MNTPPRALRRFAPFAFSTLALATSSGLLAAENASLAPMDISATASEADDSYRAATASTASKSDVPIREEAQSVQTVTPQLIQDYEVRTLDDASKFVSGVTQGNTLAGTKDAFVKRGFGSNADGSIFRDGVRSNLSHNFDATAERVEVLKGPASLLYGALEPGGLINVVSKQPQYQQRTTLSGSAYSEGGGNLGIDTTGPLGDSGFAYRLIAERQSEDYWRNYGVDQHSLVAPSLSWTGERASLTLAYSYNDYTGPVDRGTVFDNGHPSSASYDKRLDEKWSESKGITETASARYEYQLSDDWKTRLIYAWNNDRYSLDFAQPVSLAANGNLLRTANGAHYDYETQYASWDFIGRQDLLGQHHDLLVGLDHEDNDQYRGNTYRNNNASRRNININAPVYGGLAAPSLLSTTQSDQDSSLESTSLYFKDNWHLNDRWILVLGGRYQTFKQYSDQGLGRDYVVNLDKRDHAALPLAGVVFQATDTLSLYGNYSRSFVPNTTVDDRGNTFDPEEGRSFEVGAKYDLTPGLNLNVALYDIQKKNVVTTSNVAGVSVSEAAGKVSSRGLEVDLTGHLAERWDMIATYAYDHTEVLDDPSNEGKRLPQAPKHSGSLYLTHHLLVPSNLGGWHLGGGARYVGERAGDAANSFYMSSYTVADAFLRWDLPVTGYQTRLQLNVDNLFDKQYYPSSANSPLQVAVGEPRTARLSATVSF
ncbi:TonB-dependent siderophore receptor [Pseudomonas oryzihabitans]|uniref:TonB-dependent siderophore receptor n=1 Tax=Pseudomonas oryzihabitans TaxID=47885 RepID=UPI0021D7DC23|nr:TonB-dependent siderophore receptor [Pseudomonas oryzihabitans]MDK8266485.1 TonB-dependent siderophore receptor [Pseudomonas oryzihabitans]